MAIFSRLRPASRPGAQIPDGAGEAGTGLDDLDTTLSASMGRRRVVVRLLVFGALVLPALTLLARQGLTGRSAFLAPATLAFAALADRVVASGAAAPGPAPRWALAALPALVTLAAALIAVGHMNWMVPLALAASAIGSLAPARREAVLGIVACAVIGLAVAWWQRLGYANALAVALLPLLAGFLASASATRNRLIRRLRETRAELAQMAVAQERLRIARDLHDLLGHSLSLIALKAELAGRLLAADGDGAARELAELETVARESLRQVREAVAGYRQPALVAELAAARHMLAAAGVACQVEAPDAAAMPTAVDALLAWTVREGATNVVRHAGARRAWIAITVANGCALAEVADDGPGPPGAGRADAGAAGPGAAGGSGLAGLLERAAGLGGALTTGQRAEGGFLLRVRVPLPADAASHDCGPPGPRAPIPAAPPEPRADVLAPARPAAAGVPGTARP